MESGSDEEGTLDGEESSAVDGEAEEEGEGDEEGHDRDWGDSSGLGPGAPG